jgi:hypothetical protein
MPPRHAYWTIIIDDQPTSFRAHDVEELLPTFNRLREKNPTAQLKWFERGQLFDTRDAARQQGYGQGERRWEGPRPDRDDPGHRRDGDTGGRGSRPADRGEGGRDKNWRPGGEHRDPRQKYKDAKKAKWDRFKQTLRTRWEEKQGSREGEIPGPPKTLPPPRPDDGEFTPPHGDPMRPKLKPPALSERKRVDGPPRESSWERPRDDRPRGDRPRGDRPRGDRPDDQRDWRRDDNRPPRPPRDGEREARRDYRRDDRRPSGPPRDRGGWKPGGPPRDRDDRRGGWKPKGPPRDRDDRRDGWKPKGPPRGDRPPRANEREARGDRKPWGPKPPGGGSRKPWGTKPGGSGSRKTWGAKPGGGRKPSGPPRGTSSGGFRKKPFGAGPARGPRKKRRDDEE